MYILTAIIIVSSFVSVMNQANVTNKDDWREISDFISENRKEDEIVFINPFYHQDPFTYYYNEECFTKDNIYSCNFDQSRILSLNWKVDCCNDSTKLTATNDKNQMKYYINKTIWLISVRPELYDVGNRLYEYFYKRKNLVFSREFKGIEIFRFE